MTITALPTPPLRSDGPATFADRGDTFMAALPAFVTEANALGAQVSADAAAVAAAAPGAVAAANFKGEYAAGTTYQIGHSTSYGGDTWFAKTINLGVTPVTGANWQRVVAIPSQTGNSGKFLGTDGTNVTWGNDTLKANIASPTFTGTVTIPAETVLTPTLLNSWIIEVGEPAPSYWKDSFGVVHLAGRLQNGTSTMFALPTGYRPTGNVVFACMANNAFGVIRVLAASGSVSLSVGSNALVSLDGISFRTT